MKYLTWQQAQDQGVVLEVNRQLLHPRGLALQIATSKDPNVRAINLVINEDWVDAFVGLLDWASEQSEEWKAAATEVRKMVEEAKAQPDVAHLHIQDHRDDPEGVYFDDLDAEDMEKAERFEALSKTAARLEGLGYFMQPLEITGA